MCPRLIDEIDDRAVIFIGGGGEDTDGFVEQEVARGAGLEDFAVCGEMVEFSERKISITDHVPVQTDCAGFDQ